jgi:hypothetical protein
MAGLVAQLGPDPRAIRPASRNGWAAIAVTSGSKSASIILASSSLLSYATRRCPVDDQYQPE